MKKFSLMALIASSLLFVGCGDKKGTETVTETVKAKAGEAVDTVTDTVKNAAGEVVEKTTETVKETVTGAVDATKNAASGAVDATKNAASGAVDTVKDAATATATAATGAVTATADAATEATAGANGKALFAKCVSCHGADGKTKALGKSEVIAGQPAADLVKKIAEYKAGTRNVATMGALMKGQVASYSDDDIKAVAEYISTLK